MSLEMMSVIVIFVIILFLIALGYETTIRNKDKIPFKENKNEYL